MAHRFLSDDWIAAVVAAQHDYLDRVTPPATSMRLNATVKGVPFQDGPLAVHVDTSSGIGLVTKGHATDADVTLTTDYETARALLITADPQRIMAAFFDARIVVQGDLAKLIASLSESSAGADVRREIAERVRQLTDLD